MADGLEHLLLPQPSSLRAQFAPRYRLAFSLLNEDSSAGSFALDWSIDQAIKSTCSPYAKADGTVSRLSWPEYLTPTLNELSILHNFTIESHVQYHAPLAFEPTAAISVENATEFKLGDDHLKTFVNSAEWTLGIDTSLETTCSRRVLIDLE